MQTSKKQSPSSLKNDSDTNLSKNTGSSRKGLSMDETTTGKNSSRSASSGNLSNTGSNRKSR